MALTEHDKAGTYWVSVYDVDVKCHEERKLPHLVTSGPWIEGKPQAKRPNLVTYSLKGIPQNNPESSQVTYGKKPSDKAPTTFSYSGYSVEVEYDDPLVKWTVEAATVPVTLCPR